MYLFCVCVHTCVSIDMRMSALAHGGLIEVGLLLPSSRLGGLSQVVKLDRKCFFCSVISLALQVDIKLPRAGIVLYIHE